MANVQAIGHNYRLGPRVPMARRSVIEEATRTARDIPSRIMARATSTTTDCDKSDSNLCEKPSAASSMTLPIVLGVVIPLCAIAVTLFYLHRRNVKRVQQEDNDEAHKSLDFGLDLDQKKPAAGKTKRKSSFFGGEKDMFSSNKHRQLSMDMNLSSPYLLPPEIQNSRESLNSLARTLHQNEDPYRPIHSQYGSDAGSIRSARKDRDNASTYAADPISRGPSRNGRLSVVSKAPTSAMPASPAPVKKFPSVSVEPVDDEKPHRLSPIERDDNNNNGAAELQAPEPAASKLSRKSVPSEEPFIYDNRDNALPKLNLGGPFDDETYLPGQATTSNEPTVPNVVFPEHQNKDLFPDDAQEDRGRETNRRQSTIGQANGNNNGAVAQPAGLGLPATDNKRLSVGVRPLPPDELIESEDPETRANRIRSFYKEYFDDSKPDMAEYNQHYPPQGLPAEYRNNGATGGAQYYEDYDQSYNSGDAGAYFDPQSNSFVMPYAQPVQRRAMTPPPSGSRFPGGGRPRGPSAGPRNGSMGGGPMSRSGTAMSGGMRPGSSMSNMRPGSRSASNMSGRLPPPRKVLPPPESLSTLPTPSKLKDDSFALLNAIEFAPPPSFKDHAAGRSQSPLGERQEYQMKPTGTPLVSSFDEMAALPTPHMLRKSSTFTALDFAPPRKFRDPDVMSDAGSIRSNRSGISAVSQAAVRSGAGRVSRLPEDTVFTSAAMANTLKPEWGMRQ